MPFIDISRFQQFTAINLSSDPGAIGGPVIVPQCAQIVLVWLLESGKQGHNVLYGQYSGGFAGTPQQATSMLQALTSAPSWAPLAAFLPTTTSLGSLYIRDVNAPNQPIISATGGGLAGVSASPSLPNEVAVCVTLRTARVGRANRGRLYLPGFATNALGAGNIIAAGAVTAIQNWVQVLFTAMSGQGYTWSLGHRARAAYVSPKTGVSYPARPAGSLQISAATVRDNHWDSQRRRGLK